MVRLFSGRGWSALAVAVLCAAAGSAQALYKVVGSDGKITYTDRPPATVQGRVSALTDSGRSAPDPQLPIELREAIAKYPVTLYTTTECSPCETARQLLRQRGVPHTEKTVTSNDDREAWQRVVGGPEAPALRIGNKALRGLTVDEWHSYLDAAGYPRQSKLPLNYSFAQAEPLAPKPAQAAKAEPPKPAADTVPADNVSPSGIRF